MAKAGLHIYTHTTDRLEEEMPALTVSPTAEKESPEWLYGRNGRRISWLAFVLVNVSPCLSLSFAVNFSVEDPIVLEYWVAFMLLPNAHCKWFSTVGLLARQKPPHFISLSKLLRCCRKSLNILDVWKHCGNSISHRLDWLLMRWIAKAMGDHRYAKVLAWNQDEIRFNFHCCGCSLSHQG